MVQLDGGRNNLSCSLDGDFPFVGNSYRREGIENSLSTEPL